MDYYSLKPKRITLLLRSHLIHKTIAVTATVAKLLSKCCQDAEQFLKKPLFMRLDRCFDFIPTRLIHFNTKHISLVLAVFDTSFTVILPIIFGFKL